MSFLSKKTINGKERTYLEKSIRIGKKVKKFSVYVKDSKLIKNYKKELNKKIEDFQIKEAIKTYKKTRIFDKEEIEKLEVIRLNYKKIKNKLTKKQFEDIIDRFTVNFTYESNAIEGNSLTLKDVTLILSENRIIKNKDLRDVYETTNTREAMDLIFGNKFKINEKDILKLHEMLVKNTEVSFGYKKLPNFIINSNLKTTPPEKVKEEMDELLDWFNKDDNLHPLLKAILFHGKFERIHPFEDGNGRTGRLLLNIMLMKEGYPPLIVRKSQRLAYFNCLEAFDSGHTDKLERFFIQKYKKTFKNFFEVYVQYL